MVWCWLWRSLSMPGTHGCEKWAVIAGKAGNGTAIAGQLAHVYSWHLSPFLPFILLFALWPKFLAVNFFLLALNEVSSFHNPGSWNVVGHHPCCHSAHAWPGQGSSVRLSTRPEACTVHTEHRRLRGGSGKLGSHAELMGVRLRSDNYWFIANCCDCHIERGRAALTINTGSSTLWGRSCSYSSTIFAYNRMLPCP